MEIKHPEKKIVRLLSLGALAAAVILFSSCTNAPKANPVQCAIVVQAQVNIANTSGIGSSTYNEDGVGVSGSWVSDIGPSNCLGTGHNFIGTTNYDKGVYPVNGMKMNAYWQVVWDWSHTNFSACPPYSTQQPVPDSGAVFNDICHL